MSEKTVLISISIPEFEAIIVDCVKACMPDQSKNNSEHS